MTDTQKTSQRGSRIAILSAAVGLAIGIGAVYVTWSGYGNAGDNSCSASLAAAKTVEPLATGEIAAFVVAEEPYSAADLAFKDNEGAAKTLADWSGKTVFLNLWATWCAPCRKEMPAIADLQKQLGGDDFDVVAVNIDTRNPQKPKDFLSEIGVTNLSYYADPTTKIFLDLKAAGKAFGMPSTLVIGPDGCAVGHMAGPAEWASEDALDFLRAAIKASLSSG